MNLKYAFLLILLAVSFLSYGHPGHDSPIELATNKAVTLYAKSLGLEFSRPSKEFVGFSSKKTEVGVDVEVFHADSPLDVLIHQYGCTMGSEIGINCNLLSQYPRCFYFADTGNFSISDFGVAFAQGLHALSDEGAEGETINAVKIWQNGSQIFSRWLFAKLEADYVKTFSCEKSASRLNCMEVEFQPPGEP